MANPEGRPLKYTPEELLAKFEEYKKTRKNLKKKAWDNKTKAVVEVDYDLPLTLYSFCVFADIHRDTLNSYKNEREEFSDSVKKIYFECEADLIDKALIFENHAEFAKHLLIQAHGHVDSRKITQEISGPNGGPIQTQSDVDWEKLAQENPALFAEVVALRDKLKAEMQK